LKPVTVKLPLPALLGALVAFGGCVKALHEPPPLDDLGGVAAAPAPAGASVDSLLSRAEFLYAARTLDSVREASEVWLLAARADPRKTEGLVGTIRARVWLADHEESGKDRESAAEVAVQAAQWCGRIAPESAECDFWLGAALGVQARERRTTALDALPKIEEAFKRAAAAAPAMEEGGPDRALALLYARAPGWPAGPGDPDLALVHARKAVEIQAGFAPNQLALAEALAGTGDREGSRSTYQRALEMARDAVARGGDPEAPEWVEEAEKALKGLGGT
jgi:tetratricopeptide (TPR) repeat protein